MVVCGPLVSLRAKLTVDKITESYDEYYDKWPHCGHLEQVHEPPALMNQFFVFPHHDTPVLGQYQQPANMFPGLFSKVLPTHYKLRNTYILYYNQNIITYKEVSMQSVDGHVW